MNRAFACLVLMLCLVSLGAEARVTRVEVVRREAFAAGAVYGDVGAYEKIVGRFSGELDPALPLNAGIVDLDKAPRNAKGNVEYSADFYILKPVDPTKGNGALLYDVNNRGNKRSLIQFNSAPAGNDPTTAQDAGNGFLMRNGFTLVWSGWIPGLPATNDALRISVPTAGGPAAPIEQIVWDEILVNDPASKEARLSFKATSTEKGQATLYFRERNTDAAQTVPPDGWEFVDPQTIRLLPAGTNFRIGAIYQLAYKATDPPVAGIGFAATRDLVAFLRHAAVDDAGTANPLAAAGQPAILRALAHGTSQSGRYLRDFVYRGFNEDEAGRIVFEGINPHVATARLFLDFRFAQPNRMIQLGHGFMFFPDATFPFAYQNETDPVTGEANGILQRCTPRGNCPKIIHTITSTEYWQSGQSLITTDPQGRIDAAIPGGVRIYHFAGTQHVEVPTMPQGVCAMPFNTLDYRPLLRAVLLELDRWVKDGAAPPASRYPRIADGTLVEMTAPTATIPGFTMAKAPNGRARIEYGPGYAHGIIDKALPMVVEGAYGVRVPKVDGDGNEITSLRLPEQSVPTGTATGWSVRGAQSGGAGELCYLDGAFIPFAKTKAEREATGDTRLSLEERYRTPSEYQAQIRQAAVALGRDGYLLPEDIDRIAQKAAAVTW